MERERVREEEKQRAQERIDLATNAAQGVQALTERAMKDESAITVSFKMLKFAAAIESLSVIPF